MKNIFFKKNTRYFNSRRAILFFCVFLSLFFAVYLLLFYGKLAFSAETDIQISVPVFNCNNNGICESGEDEAGCSNDCGCNFDDICEAGRGETSDNCSDCPVIIPPVIPPASSPAGGSGIIYGGDTLPPIISAVEIKRVGLGLVQIAWRTNEPAACSLRVGRDINSLVLNSEGISFLSNHLMEVQGLETNSAYIFQVKCFDQAYNRSEFLGSKFETLLPIDNTAPGNVSSFRAVYEKGAIKLSWKNPPDSDLAGVRILRSDIFFLSNPWQGLPIYYDKKESFIDKNVKLDTKYYYSAFSYDYVGNYSSGAVVSVLTPKLVEEIVAPIVSPTSSIVIPPIQDIFPEDILIREKGEEDGLLQGSEVQEGVLYHLVIPKDKIPAGTVQVIVDIKQDGEISSILLKKDRNGDFVGELPQVFADRGNLLNFEVFFYDNQNNIIAFLEAESLVKVAQKIPAKEPFIKKIGESPLLVFLFVFPFVLFALLLILKRIVRGQR